MSLFQLFRKKPDDNIINELLQTTGFNSLEDPKKISRIYLENPEVLEKYIKLQESISEYYIPCKCKKYIVQSPTPKNIITIIRHFIKTKGYSVQSQEKYQSGKKIVIYRIVPKVNDPVTTELHVVKFD